MSDVEDTVEVQDLLVNCKDAVAKALRQRGTSVDADGDAVTGAHDWLQYQVRDGLRAEVRHPGGSTTNYLTHPYAMSKGGIGFINGCFLFPGSRCGIEIQLPDGDREWVEGRVTRCDYISGKLHDVQVKFDALMKRGLYDSETDVDDSEEETFVAAQRTVLLFVTSESEYKSIKELLDRLSVETAEASSPDEAADLWAENKYDGAFVSAWDGADGDGPRVARSLGRTVGNGAVIGLACGGGQEHKALVEAGCVEVIDALDDYEAILRVFDEHLCKAADNQQVGKPLLSARWNDTSLQPMILHYLGQLPSQLNTVRRLMLAGETQESLSHLRDIQGSCAAFGFDKIAKVVVSLREAIGENQGGETIQQFMTQLSAQVGRALLVCQDESAVEAA